MVRPRTAAPPSGWSSKGSSKRGGKRSFHPRSPRLPPPSRLRPSGPQTPPPRERSRPPVAKAPTAVAVVAGRRSYLRLRNRPSRRSPVRRNPDWENVIIPRLVYVKSVSVLGRDRRSLKSPPPSLICVHSLPSTLLYSCIPPSVRPLKLDLMIDFVPVTVVLK